jgi:hypothetical protein
MVSEAVGSGKSVVTLVPQYRYPDENYFEILEKFIKQYYIQQLSIKDCKNFEFLDNTVKSRGVLKNLSAYLSSMI